MKITAVVVMVLTVAASPAWANTCTSGQPCGDTCISWSETCHVGGGGSMSTTAIFASLGLLCGSAALWGAWSDKRTCDNDPSIPVGAPCPTSNLTAFWATTAAGFFAAALYTAVHRTSGSSSATMLSLAIPY